ncbi:PQQ-dependent sugar dehydrogenase [Agriterribacter sp.]|uniref:PQQ-dependent sugar dehydrogenase n=1 Tax=Agriterribacter sp. TaxID=2821509 RepID=UPI002CC1085C|nr:PQQ-dependent sugar dehydrogenase [Agriterribacter sp.]HRP57876.1 PQQ-dependent sugar dehydrogenase [Agriterribacter sp.]
MQMKTFACFSVIAAAVSFCGCAGNSSSANTAGGSAADSATLPPVETNAPNVDYKPAFEGQTRVNGVKTTTPYKVEKIAENLGRPWAVVPMPDGRLLITEKSGYMEIHSADGALVKKITGFPKVDDAGQGGMLDVAFDPEFAQNKTIYWSFSERQGKGNLMAVAKGQISADEATIQNPTVIFRATPALESKNHFGSRLIFDKDGNLFVSTGERSILEGRKQAQWLNSGLGKIFKITKEGKPAPGNPFIDQKDAMPEIYAYGVRNPQSLDLHPVTGDLWEVEFGPRGGDEVNIIEAGKNYGWPTITYGIEYDGRKIGDSIQQKEGLQQPVYYWDPVVSPSGMVFYTGDDIPEWKNNLFISGLSSMHIVRLVIENNKVVGEERLLEDKKERFRDVAQSNGVLYAVTDGGNMYRISKQ